MHYIGIKTKTESGKIAVQVWEATVGNVIGQFPINSTKIPEYCTIFEEWQESDFWYAFSKYAPSEKEKEKCCRRAEKALFKAIESKRYRK